MKPSAHKLTTKPSANKPSAKPSLRDIIERNSKPPEFFDNLTPLTQVEQIRADLPDDLKKWLDANVEKLREHKRRLAKRKHKPIGVWARMEAMDTEEMLALRAKWHNEAREARRREPAVRFRKHASKQAKKRVEKLSRRIDSVDNGFVLGKKPSLSLKPSAKPSAKRNP